jgi:hypothetical protein
MEDPKYRFLSFRLADKHNDHLPEDAPPAVICKALEEAGVPYEMITTKLERQEACNDEDTQDLYPNGPDSGPDFVMLYDFITDKDNFDRASAIADVVYNRLDDA